MTTSATSEPEPRRRAGALPARAAGTLLLGHDHPVAGLKIASYNLRVGIVVEADGDGDANRPPLPQNPHRGGVGGPVADRRRRFAAGGGRHAARHVAQRLVWNAEDVLA